MKTIILLAVSFAAFGQQTVTPANVTFSADAVVAVQSWFTTQILSTPTTLAAPMTAGATTMTVTSAADLAVNQEFYIDSEAVNPSAIAGNVVTITRADIGTTAKAHATGAQVNVLKYKSLKNFCKQVMQAAVADIMSRATYPTGATQDAAIAAANAVKASAVAGSVQ